MTRVFLCSLALALLTGIPAQARTGARLRGRVTDESGAVVPGAKVEAIGSELVNSQIKRSATTDGVGNYVIEDLPSGSYNVSGSTAELVISQPVQVTLASGTTSLDLRLVVKAREDHLLVEETTGPAVSTDSASNASGLILSGEALDALSDNPDDLQADLQALAGPSAGPNGGSIYVDDFSGGEIPPKNSIREIRINQDPFSPEFDKLGYGRIEIFTKPGTKRYHGTIDYNLGADVWNSRNPYAAEKAPLLLNEFEGGGGGYLSKHSSFTVDAQRNMVDNGSVVNAVTLDPLTLAVQPSSSVFKTIQRYTRVTPRVDYQIGENNTLSVRYGVTRGDINGAGIGGFDLISRGYHTSYTTQTVQASETAVLGAAVNETRFQYYRNALQMIANDQSPILQVLGSFTGGGSQFGHSADTQNSFEVQNYTTILHAAHALRFGARLRGLVEESVSPVDFNGTYTFTGGVAPVLDAVNQPVGNLSESISSIEQYRRTLLFQRLGYSPILIRELGGGAAQFSISTGTPALTRNQLDFAFFAGDNWRLRPNFSLSYGLRYEAQTNIGDWRDLAPRFSFAWSPDSGGNSQRKSVLRAGFGIFYDRFVLTNTITADRYNGVAQRQYVLTDPDTFPNIPSVAELSGSQSPQVVQRVASDLRAPYIIQSAATFERQVASNTTFAVTYTNSHGLHLLRSRDVNAPLPGTFAAGAPSSGVYPLGADTGPVLLMESAGLYNQNQMIVNVNTRLNRNVNLFGFYVFNHARSNTDGINSLPANSYDFRGEYGPAATDVRHRVSFGGSITTKWNIRVSPFVILQSGLPFNITSGTDTFGTSVFNARPGLPADPQKPGLVQTIYGLLDPNPALSQAVLSRNYGRGPGLYTVNLRFSKGFGFGPEKGGGAPSGTPVLSSGQRQAAATGGIGFGRLLGAPTTSRKYSLILTMSARNLLNHNNPGPIIGNITSPLFGQANQVAGAPNAEGFSENASNRRLEMQIRFTF